VLTFTEGSGPPASTGKRVARRRGEQGFPVMKNREIAVPREPWGLHLEVRQSNSVSDERVGAMAVFANFLWARRGNQQLPANLWVRKYNHRCLPPGGSQKSG
jgi:hypothetical protein